MRIVVPKPLEGSFNPLRKISDLVKSQVLHMREVEKRLPLHEQTGQNVEEITTEAEASEYIRKITEKLHGSDKGKVLEPSEDAFKEGRPLTDFLKSHVQHFRAVEKKLPARQQTGADIKAIQSEAQAADYITRVTAMLHGKRDPRPTSSGERRS